MTNFYEIWLGDGRQTLCISPSRDSGLRLLEDGLDGFGATELFVETKPYGDGTGGHPVTRRFGERCMKLTAEMAAGDDGLRRKICAMMNPLHTLDMEVTLGEVTRRIRVIPWGRPRFRQPNFFTPTEVTLSFLAPDPFYRANRAEEVLFRQTAPLFAFPLNLMAGAGTAAGLLRRSDTVTVTNGGDADCGFQAYLTAAGGEVINPVIRCGDRFIRAETVLRDGETLEMDTRPRCKDLRIDGVRSFTFHRDSDFFLLSVGENRISVSADSGGEYLSARLTYTPLYYGI